MPVELDAGVRALGQVELQVQLDITNLLLRVEILASLAVDVDTFAAFGDELALVLRIKPHVANVQPIARRLPERIELAGEQVGPCFVLTRQARGGEQEEPECGDSSAEHA